MNALRVPPSDEWLARQRQRHEIPDDWVWVWCSNPACAGVVFVPPIKGEVEGRGAVFLPVCSAACSMPAFLAHSSR